MVVPDSWVSFDSLLQTVPDIELLNIDKQQSELYPHLTQLADVLDGTQD